MATVSVKGLRFSTAMDVSNSLECTQYRTILLL